MTMTQIEQKFQATLKSEGIPASITITKSAVSVCVESETLVEKVQRLMSQVKAVVFDSIDFYAADEDMPEEYYIRYNFA